MTEQELEVEIFNILLKAQGSIKPEHHPRSLAYQIRTLIGENYISKEEVGKLEVISDEEMA